jgi:hypothetical protein
MNDGLLRMLNGNAVWVDGKVGGAINLDGYDNGAVVVLSSTSIESMTNAMTVAMWVNRDSGAGSDLFSRSSGSGGHAFELSISSESRLVFLGARIGVHTASFAGRIAADHTWYHVAATYDGSRIILYLNGTVVYSANRSGSGNGTIGPAGTAPIIIGGDQAGTFTINQVFQGMIDDVRLYKRALSAAEIAALMR